MTGFADAVKKHVKVLLRNRVAATTVLLAPVLIAFLIGFAYTGSAAKELGVGVTNTSSRYAGAIDEVDGVKTTVVADIATCDSQVKSGALAACVNITPGETTTVDLITDQSRTDLTETIRTSVQRAIQSEGTEQREQIVSDRYTSLNETLADITAERQRLQRLADNISDVYDELDEAATTDTVSETEADDIDTESLNDVSNALSDVESSLDSLASDADDHLDVTNSSPEWSALNDSVNESEDVLADTDVDQLVSDADSAVEDVESALESLEDSVGDANRRIDSVTGVAADAASRLSEAEATVRGVADSLVDVEESLSSLTATSVARVANPVDMSVDNVGTSGFSFGKATPYLLAVQTFLFALLLGGALSFIESSGTPSFRERLAPTNHVERVLSLLTAALLLCSIVTSVTVVTAVAYLGLWELIAPWTVAAIMLCGALVALLLGIALGQVFETMHGLLLGILTTGSVFIAFSNFAAPLETLPRFARLIGSYNPFNVLGEALRRALFFGDTLNVLWPSAAVLGGISAAGLAIAAGTKYRFTADTTSQSAEGLVSWRLRLRRADSLGELCEVVESMPYLQYLRAYPYIRRRVGVLGGSDPATWTRTGFVDEVQSSSSMSSMSSSDSKSSSSSSAESSDTGSSSASSSSSSSVDPSAEDGSDRS